MEPTCRHCGDPVSEFGKVCEGCFETGCPYCLDTGILGGANAGLECPYCDGTGTYRPEEG